MSHKILCSQLRGNGPSSGIYMSGLDYTKKPEISNMPQINSSKLGSPESDQTDHGLMSKLKDMAYMVSFLHRTRYEKWLLILSLFFGLTGLICSVWMIGKINMPAELTVNCDLDMVRKEAEKVSLGLGVGQGKEVESDNSSKQDNKMTKSKTPKKSGTNTKKSTKSAEKTQINDKKND